MSSQTVEQVTQYGISRPASRILAAAGAVSIAAGSGLIAYLDPAKTSYVPACPVLSLTGYACPGCGMTRGLHSLFHGDVISAIDFNALIPFATLVVAYGFLSLVLYAIRGRGLPMGMVKPIYLIVVLVVLIGFGILRNIPVYPFTILFP